MKKVLAIVFLGSLVAVSCSKKADKSLQDSNTMLEEPEVTTVVDSTAKTVEAPAPVATPAPSDSASVK